MTEPAGSGEDPPTDKEIAAAMLALLAARGLGKSICPSDAARHVAGEQAGETWRAWMPAIRRVAAKLCEQGLLRATQGAKAVDPLAARGPIRLRLPE